MTCPRTVVVMVTVAALVVAGAAEAAVRGPSERACLIAWNSPVNRANHLRLLAEQPIASLSLRAGVAGTDTWTKGSPPTSTSGPACLMTIAKRGRMRIVIGMWRGRGVERWTFGRASPTNNHVLPANVRLLPDGRVTKIYRR